MNKETLSNYGWIVICVLVLAVMIALATPFGGFIRDAVWSTTHGLFDTSENALGSIENLVNPFYGKTAVFLGDSQTEENSHKSKTYIDWLKETLNLGDCYNYGLSGSPIIYNQSTVGQTSMCMRYENMNDDVDMVFVMGGINDSIYRWNIGTVNDTGNTTFYGAVRYLCKGLKEKYPNTPIAFITPTLSTNGDVTPYVVAMKEVCQQENILCLDAFGSLGINPNIDNTYTTDGVHLNDLGHEKLGKWLSSQVKNQISFSNINQSTTPVAPADFPKITLTSTNHTNFFLSFYFENKGNTDFATNTGKEVVCSLTYKNHTFMAPVVEVDGIFGLNEKNNLSAGSAKISNTPTVAYVVNEDGSVTCNQTFITTTITANPYIAIPFRLANSQASFVDGWSADLVDVQIEIDGIVYEPEYIGGLFSYETVVIE